MKTNKNILIDYKNDKNKVWEKLSNEIDNTKWHYTTDVKLLFIFAVSLFLIIVLVYFARSDQGVPSDAGVILKINEIMSN